MFATVQGVLDEQVHTIQKLGLLYMIFAML